MMVRRLAVVAGAVLLTACGGGGTASGPGGVTVDEAEALDQAAEMLDSQRLPEGALDEPGATGPSPAASPHAN